MRIVIDQARCEGHGVCEATAPDDLYLDEEDRAQLRRAEVPAAGRAAALEAVRRCPVAALSTVE